MTPLIVAVCVLTIAALVFWAERRHNRHRSLDADWQKRLQEEQSLLVTWRVQGEKTSGDCLLLDMTEPAPVPDLEDVIYAQLMETSRRLEEGVVKFHRKETCKNRKKPMVFYDVSLPFHGRRYHTYFCTAHALDTKPSHTPYWERACRRLAKQIAEKQREGAKA